MISLYDVLLAASNIHVDDPIAEIWGRGLQDRYKIIEYTGALPTTINADGNVLLDYRIYGNTVQNGTPTPENPIMPIGCGERTENLFDINSLYSTVIVQGQTFTKPASAYFFDVFSGSDGGSTPMNLQKSIPVTSGTYTLSFEESETKIAVVFSDGETQTVIAGSSSVTLRTFDVSSDGYISIRCENPAVCSVKKLQIIKGSTAPTSYIPYGYKLPMTVGDGNTVQTTPVYIGENTLDANEYVSYSDGKIYRMVDGTLTPTDPPVPLPNIPTIKGETIIDYDGDPKPSQVYVKYKGKKAQ